MTAITKSQKYLLDILGHSLFDYQYEETQTIDYDELFDEAVKQAVFPIVFSDVSNQGNFGDKWGKVFNQIISNNIRVQFEHCELNDVLSDIQFVTIKGAASSAYYPNPTLRTFGDVDYLVRKEDLDSAGKRLVEKGFVCTEDDEHGAHLVYHREPNSTWEMHWSLCLLPENEGGKNTRQFLENIIEAAVTLETEYGDCIVPDTFHHGLVLLVHTAGHLINGGIGIRHLCDWAVFVNSIKEFEKIFEDKLKKCGLWRFAQLLTQVSSQYLHLPEKKWAMTDVDPALLESMICDIISAGNFGNKDKERINQAKFVTDNTGSVAEKSMIAYLFGSVNNKAKAALPLCARFVVLRPAGWLYVLVRHCVRIKKGERRKINLKDMADGASERRSIYRRFCLYKEQ